MQNNDSKSFTILTKNGKNTTCTRNVKDYLVGKGALRLRICTYVINVEMSVLWRLPGTALEKISKGNDCYCSHIWGCFVSKVVFSTDRLFASNFRLSSIGICGRLRH